MKIIQAELNEPFDRYPDIFCVLEDKRRVPAEVEWKTSSFNHDIDVLREAGGFIIVYVKDQNFELDQVEIDHDDFRSWYVSQAGSLFDDSIRDLKFEIKERKFPELWFYYLDGHPFLEAGLSELGPAQSF